MLRFVSLSLLCCLTASCQRAPAVETVDVLVAARDIPAGTVLEEPEKSVRSVAYLRGSEPESRLTDVLSLKGKATARPIWKDQPLKSDDFDCQRFALTKECVLLHLSVSADTNGGFILPGSRVDLLEVDASKEELKVRILLRNLTVLDVRYAASEFKDVLTFALPKDDAAVVTQSAALHMVRPLVRREDVP